MALVVESTGLICVWVACLHLHVFVLFFFCLVLCLCRLTAHQFHFRHNVVTQDYSLSLPFSLYFCLFLSLWYDDNIYMFCVLLLLLFVCVFFFLVGANRRRPLEYRKGRRPARHAEWNMCVCGCVKE